VSGARWRTVGALTALLALAVAGCGNGRVVVPVTIDPTRLAALPNDTDLATHDAAVRGLGAVMVKDLGLRLPERVNVYVYTSRQTFERGLIHDAQVSPSRAAELSEFAIGIGKRRQLLLYDEGTKGREWLRLVAHELAHVSQIELAQGEGRAEQWLAEGMAEWVAFTVLERLGLDRVEQRRAMSARGIRNHAALVAARLDLETLGSPRGFTVRHLREGSLPTYQLAFLMADYLITRDGFARVIEYFQSFSHSDNRRDNFRRAFGQSLEEFEREILTHLMTVVR